MKQQSPAGEGPAVELENKFVEMSLQSIVREGSLMGAEQPSPQQCNQAPLQAPLAGDVGEVEHLVVLVRLDA